MTTPAPAPSFDAVVQPCPLAAAATPPHWLEIELLGEDDKGIPHEPFLVRLPDGQEVAGYLDAAGLARLDGIVSAGTCQVSFPERDKDAWQPLAAPTSTAQAAP